MATFLTVLLLAGFFAVALSETTDIDEQFPRCEFRLNGVPIPQGETDDQPAECYNYGPLEREAWEKENDKFDEFNESLRQTELNLFNTNKTFLMDDDETIQIVSNNHQDNKIYVPTIQPEERTEEVEAMDFEFRQILHHHLNVFNKSGECQKRSEDVATYCDCLIEIRNDMITCLNDLNKCFNIAI